MKNVERVRGFTLVEVIVVGVVAVLLAGVAIPQYISYINNTKQAAVNNLAQTAAVAANAYYRKTGTDPTVAQLGLFYDATTYSITISTPNVTVTYIANTSFTKTINFHN